jgi:tRNA G18 (ribose-2'-O)-methylase SpoU
VFVAEGRFVVQRLLARPGYVTRSVLLTPTAFSALTRAVAREALARVPVYIADQDVLDDIAGFSIHRGCLALAERPCIATLDSSGLAEARRVVVLEGVNNPDNVGGIFRSAAAFDVDVIVLGPACGDPLYRKAIRTSMAATLDVPYRMSTDWPGTLAVIRAAGLRVLALTPRSRGVALESLSTGGRVALLLGSEGEGLSEQALEHADQHVHIRMSDRVDSLNVTVAASIAMHHFFR